MTNKCSIGLDPIKMGQMIEKVDNIHERTEEILVKVNKQNGRVGKLEQWKSRIIGIGSVLVIAVPIAIKYLF